jgi:HD-GYP domain-containing protein (c-di-GMP phosphodiesterase class II)
MKCSEEDLEVLAFAGYLHDIGKIGVSDSILTKSGKLTPSEYEAIKLHPVIGDHIVEPLGLLQTEREIIKYHHERPDGKGYPEGLMGEEIPRLARIMAVADAFDAMTSTRSYRQALELDFAVEELKRYSGKMFDLEVVKAALSYINQMGNVATQVG